MNEDIVTEVLLTQIARNNAIPKRNEIEQQLDGILTLAPQLEASRHSILSRVLDKVFTEVLPSEEMVDPKTYVKWLENADRSKWASWPWLKLYLAKKQNRPQSVINELEESTDRVLDLLADPQAESCFDRRGLVVGHVQSGKTQHYTALMAKAIDAGYKIIIILSGIHENLRQQTQERIEECISGKNSRDNFNPFGIRLFQQNYKVNDKPLNSIPDIITMTAVEGDFGAAVNRRVNVPLGGDPVIYVVKKNATILRNLLNTLRGKDDRMSFLKHPTLIIDDEADHSSVNAAKEDENPKRINEQIRKLLWCCNKVAYVGYTATPYANIFMDDTWVEKTEDRTIDECGSDLFPRSFIISLSPPSNYIGPETVFGHQGDDASSIDPVEALPMSCYIKDADTWLPPRHRNNHKIGSDIPESLQKAVKCFILTVSARMALGDQTAHCSMLIHVTRFNSVQARVLKQVKTYVENLQNNLGLANNAIRKDLENDFKQLWISDYETGFEAFQQHPSQQLNQPRLPDWETVNDHLIPAINRIKLSLVNSATNQGLDFSSNKKNGLVVIAVGGDRLSRGLTLEGLCVSYFLRGARAFDTLMQMGRWFGYRPGYAHLCKVFAPASIIHNFSNIVLATEELRNEFHRMSYLGKTPADFGLQVREPRGDMIITSINKMRRGELVKVHFSNSLIESLDIREKDLLGNFASFRKFLDSMNKENNLPYRMGEDFKQADSGGFRVWNKVDCKHVLNFLENYRAVQSVCLDPNEDTDKSLLLSYLETVIAKGELKEWTVAVIGKKNGQFSVEGMDSDFRAVGRKRLMDEVEKSQPLHPDRFSFKGISMGSYERLDLSEEQIKKVEQIIQNNPRLSKASCYRSERKPSNGLLLITPVIPKVNDQEELPAEGVPVISIAVSLPCSQHDKGTSYRCTRQKIREMFGQEFCEDDERDNNEVAEV